MNSIQYNKSMTRAIKLLGDTGYKVRNIFIAEASFGKNRLDYALFVATVGSYGEIHEVTVSVQPKHVEIRDIKKVL
jgi:hypothetical protein